MINIYRWLIALYPVAFREEYGWLMIQVFEDMCRDARRAQGITGLIRVWVRTLFDLTITLPKEHLESRGYRRTTLMDVQTFNTQMNTTVEAFIRDLRDGYSVLQCVERVSATAEEPTASEFNRLKEEIQAGAQWHIAFDHLQERVNSQLLGRFIDAFTIQRAEGGNLADRLQEILDTTP